MFSTLPKHWAAMVLRFRSLIWGLERQMPPGEFDSEKFEAGWVQLNLQGTKILTVLSDPPTGVWPKDLARLEAFHQAVNALVVASYQEGRPESVAEILALCNDLADRVIDGKLLLDYEPEPIFDRAKGKDSAKGKGPAKGKVPKPKEGGAMRKIISTLTRHHKYSNGSLLNQTPIGVNELARVAEVSTGSASGFFKKQFGGLGKYKRMCMESSRLIFSLKLLNAEFSPKILFNKASPQVDAPDE